MLTDTLSLKLLLKNGLISSFITLSFLLRNWYKRLDRPNIFVVYYYLSIILSFTKWFIYNLNIQLRDMLIDHRKS